MQNLITQPDERLNAREFRGGKYLSGRSVKECAACIRTDLKEAVKTGKLPQGKYSVVMRHHHAITVTLSDLQFVTLNRARVALQSAFPNLYPPNDSRLCVYSAMGKALMERVESMVNAYQRDDSDVQSDYFDVNFYEDVKYDWEWEKGQRSAIEAQEKACPRYEFNVKDGSLVNWSEKA